METLGDDFVQEVPRGVGLWRFMVPLMSAVISFLFLSRVNEPLLHCPPPFQKEPLLYHLFPPRQTETL